MNDKELADKVVALGVGSISIRDGDNEYCIMGAFIRADIFVRDWRVAGALMEKMMGSDICHRIGADRWDREDDYSWLNDPRAIIEACVEALAEDKT